MIALAIITIIQLPNAQPIPAPRAARKKPAKVCHVGAGISQFPEQDQDEKDNQDHAEHAAKMVAAPIKRAAADAAESAK